jgi:hypothetical protein
MVIRNIVLYGDAINIPWRLMIQSYILHSFHSMVTAECMTWENKGTRMTRLYMEKDEAKMVFGGCRVGRCRRSTDMWGHWPVNR